MFVQYAVFDVKFSAPTKFLMKGFHSDKILNDAFCVSVRYIGPKFIFHQIIDIYTHIRFMNKELSIFFRNYMCDTTK